MKIHGRIFLLFLFFSTALAAPHIQVRIGKDLEQVLIQGMDLKSQLFFRDESSQYRGRKAINFNCRGKGKHKRKKAILLASLSSPTGIISWKDRHYRGDLLVAVSDGLSSCDLIQQITMENYISSLLAKEMDGTWPVEALKAQAVAARTYAMFKKEKNKKNLFTIENSEKHQVSGSFFDETINTREAANATQGFVLVNRRGELVPAFFHSKCGGRTYLPQRVWLTPVDGHREVQCPFCHRHGTRDWKKLFARKKIEALLREAISPPGGGQRSSNSVRILAEQKERDYISFHWGNGVKKVPKSYLRRRLGRRKLPSNNFTIHQGKGRIIVKGKGFGHGVGMCQYGAFEMARQGRDYKQILRHYYPQLSIRKLY